MKLQRNDPCHCGSGKKYKKCCAAKDEAAQMEGRQKAELGDAAGSRRAQASSGSGSAGSVTRPKGPPPKGPTQIRRRAV